jgi:hypothetical protein
MFTDSQLPKIYLRYIIIPHVSQVQNDVNTDTSYECAQQFALCYTSHMHIVAHCCDVLDVPKKNG